eukprot:scaffold17458_cov140-Isochrysis_galbana.AAC.1
MLSGFRRLVEAPVVAPPLPPPALASPPPPALQPRWPPVQATQSAEEMIDDAACLATMRGHAAVEPSARCGSTASGCSACRLQAHRHRLWSLQAGLSSASLGLQRPLNLDLDLASRGPS